MRVRSQVAEGTSRAEAVVDRLDSGAAEIRDVELELDELGDFAGLIAGQM